MAKHVELLAFPFLLERLHPVPGWVQLALIEKILHKVDIGLGDYLRKLPSAHGVFSHLFASDFLTPQVALPCTFGLIDLSIAIAQAVVKRSQTKIRPVILADLNPIPKDCHAILNPTGLRKRNASVANEVRKWDNRPVTTIRFYQPFSQLHGLCRSTKPSLSEWSCGSNAAFDLKTLRLHG